MDAWFNILVNSDRFRGDGPESTVFGLLLSFVIGQVIGWVYQRTHRGMAYSQSFTASLVVLPVLVALMMLLMSGSLTIAFGLLAVFAVVRFRNVLKDTRDTIFVLWSIIEGMAVGTGQISSGVIGVFGVTIVLVYLAVTNYGTRRSYDTILNLNYMKLGARDVLETIQQILLRHCLDTQLVSTQETGSELVNLSYRLVLRDPSRRGELESDLRSVNSVEQVSTFAHEDESEM